MGKFDSVEDDNLTTSPWLREPLGEGPWVARIYNETHELWMSGFLRRIKATKNQPEQRSTNLDK